MEIETKRQCYENKPDLQTAVHEAGVAEIAQAAQAGRVLVHDSQRVLLHRSRTPQRTLLVDAEITCPGGICPDVFACPHGRFVCPDAPLPK